MIFRRPQGAVPCGTPVRIAASVRGDGILSVELRIWDDRDGKETILPMQIDGTHASVTVPSPETPRLLWYYFIIRRADGSVRYYGGDSGEGRLSLHEPSSYQITFYDSAFRTPDWAGKAVAYQIFPDRFKRSSWEDFCGRTAYHKGLGRFIRMHDRWSEEVCTAPSPGQMEYMPDDFFGGDLNGIREKLPYLADLGVSMIYLNPIFESASNHRYDTADYDRIDPILGTNGEFEALCREAGGYGIRILLDGVFSHTGADSRYFDRYSRYPDVGAYESKDSPYSSWYTFYEYPDSYSCWWDFPALPNVEETDPAYSEFITGEDGILRHWFWRGAAGWRLDVADELPDSFIRKIRNRIKADSPDNLLIGEVWEDCSTKTGPEGRRGYVYGDELDGAMNYPFTDAVIAFFTGKEDAYGLNHALQKLREHYPKPFYDCCQNSLSTHDIVRALTALSGAPDRRSVTRKQQAGFQASGEAEEKGKKLLILATALQMTIPGIPCVYYGDEAGMTGMGDPFNRRTYPWGKEDKKLIAAFRTLMRARRYQKVLQTGCMRMGALSPDVFAVVRYTEDGSAVAALILNRSTRDQAFGLDPESLMEGPDGGTPVSFFRNMKEVFSGEEVQTGNMLSGEIPALTAKLYLG